MGLNPNDSAVSLLLSWPNISVRLYSQESLSLGVEGMFYFGGSLGLSLEI